MFTSKERKDLPEALPGRDTSIITSYKAAHSGKPHRLLNVIIEKTPVATAVVIYPVSEALKIVAESCIFLATFSLSVNCIKK